MIVIILSKFCWNPHNRFPPTTIIHSIHMSTIAFLSIFTDTISGRFLPWKRRVFLWTFAVLGCIGCWCAFTFSDMHNSEVVDVKLITISTDHPVTGIQLLRGAFSKP
eukprot:UN14772